MSAPSLIRDTRRASRLTQAQLAERIGISQGGVAQLERAGANPTIERLDEVLRATGHRLVLRAIKSESAVDETLLARNLRMTPAERLAAFQHAHRELEELKALMPDAG